MCARRLKRTCKLDQWTVKVKNKNLVLYQAYLENKTSNFDELWFTYLLREDNQIVHILAKLPSMIAIPGEQFEMIRSLLIEDMSQNIT